MTLQPYQEATEERARQKSAPGKALGEVAGLASAVIGGSALISKALPLLNRFVPQELALKGLSHINPRLGKFAKGALASGQSWDNVSDFIKSKAESELEESEVTKENRNVIEQYSPELHQFIDSEIRKGRTAIEAGALAQNDKRFKDIINKLSKDHKTPWSNILESVYGNQSQKAPPQNAQSIKDLLAQGSFGGQPQQSPQQPQQGGADQAKQQLMQAMQALSQKLRT